MKEQQVEATAKPRIYKGIPTAIEDLRIGQVVQVLDASPFAAGTVTAGSIGVVKNIQMGVYKMGDCLPSISVMQGDSFSTILLKGPVYGTSVPPTCKALQVLTGSKEKLVRSRFYEEQYKTYSFRCHGSLGSGCDPEIFVVGTTGEVMPAWEFLPEKAAVGKQSYSDYGNDFQNVPAYWDGFQAEFETYPMGCVNSLVDNIRGGLKTVLEAARKKDPGARLSANSVLPVDDGLLQKADNRYVSLGCMPSMNAYNAAGRAVDDPRMLPVRFAGGHVHLSGHSKFTNATTLPAIIRTIDALAGIAFVAALDGIDNPVRRQYYGLAGEYRMPSHGLEYRTLSNAWVCHPALAHLAFDLVRCAAMMEVNSVRMPSRPADAEVQRIINECDVTAARKCIDDNWQMWRRIVACYYTSGGATQTGSERLLRALLFSGVKEMMDIAAIEENWLLRAEIGNIGAYGGATVVIDGMQPRTSWAIHSESIGCSVMSLVKNMPAGAPPAEAPQVMAAAAAAGKKAKV